MKRNFFLMRPRPPRSTLCPYTTLCRSPGQPRVVRGAEAGVGAQLDDRGALLARQRGTVVARRGVDDDHRRPLGEVSLQDRKSTRLNSSHANISYAAFCLKT